MTSLIRRCDLLNRPEQVVAAINLQIAGADAAVLVRARNLVVVEVTFAPPLELKPAGYPQEGVRITQFADSRRHLLPYAVPVGPDRTWEHRYPPQGPISLEPLCLWYPDDPPALRWDWSKGFMTYVAVVQRHLWNEEHFRRNGRWPSEDAPHGNRSDGTPHPIRSLHNLSVTRTAR